MGQRGLQRLVVAPFVCVCVCVCVFWGSPCFKLGTVPSNENEPLQHPKVDVKKTTLVSLLSRKLALWSWRELLFTHALVFTLLRSFQGKKGFHTLTGPKPKT